MKVYVKNEVMYEIRESLCKYKKVGQEIDFITLTNMEFAQLRRDMGYPKLCIKDPSSPEGRKVEYIKFNDIEIYNGDVI